MTAMYGAGNGDEDEDRSSIGPESDPESIGATMYINQQPYADNEEFTSGVKAGEDYVYLVRCGTVYVQTYNPTTSNEQEAYRQLYTWIPGGEW